MEKGYKSRLYHSMLKNLKKKSKWNLQQGEEKNKRAETNETETRKTTENKIMKLQPGSSIKLTNPSPE